MLNKYFLNRVKWTAGVKTTAKCFWLNSFTRRCSPRGYYTLLFFISLLRVTANLSPTVPVSKPGANWQKGCRVQLHPLLALTGCPGEWILPLAECFDLWIDARSALPLPTSQTEAPTASHSTGSAVVRDAPLGRGCGYEVCTGRGWGTLNSLEEFPQAGATIREFILIPKVSSLPKAP